MRRKHVLLFLGFFAFAKLSAQTNSNSLIVQDTLLLNLTNAEKLFLDSNLYLLAARYNVDAQKALIIQAKLIPNPNFSYARGPVIPLHDDQ
ncbi:hypothetical protein ABTN71_19635, partial [Acinetobacter baumannii]